MAKQIHLPEFSVKTAEYAVGPRNPLLFRNDEVKLSGDLCEMVEDICLPCAVPRVIGSIGEGWFIERVDALDSSCRLEGLIGATGCCMRVGYGEALFELAGNEGKRSDV
jgi:hypothetical protein